MKSDILTILETRGFIHQLTDRAGLSALLSGSSPAVFYIGFDCTAPSLHAGSLMQIMLLRWLQKAGHKPIVLMGGGTTRIGDPSGKDEARKMLTDDDITANLTGIAHVFSRFLTFGEGPTDAVMVNNADWLDGLSYIPFLRDVGRHFSVNRMLTMESVKRRLEREQPLSFLEFNYMVLQAYDFLELSRRYGCRLQCGGSDQWGNITCGIDITRRLAETEVYGLTTPLLATASGAKMGKSADGAVWLSAEMLSPYAYWQYWRNTDDRDVGRFLRLFTELPMAEIERLERLEGAALNDAKKVLATEVTALCHGREQATLAAETARQTFEQGGLGEEIPTLEVSRTELEAGIPAYALLARAELATSNGEARRLIRGGGAKLNGDPIATEDMPITSAHLSAEGFLQLSAGKKRHVRVVAR
jgi:tyrosyl-tRNA synthetase